MGRVKWLKWTLIGGACAAVAAVLVLTLAPRPVDVDAAAVQVGPIADSLSDQGMARVREAYVVSAPVSGRMERVDLHVGDRVIAGQTLVARLRPVSAALMDPSTRARAEASVTAAVAAIRAGEADRDQLTAQARNAEGELGRIRALSEKGFATAQTLDTADAKARAARAAVRAATAQLAMRRSELVSARAALIGPEAASAGAVPVTSPANGYVTRVLQESERIVSLGAPLVEVSDQRGLEAAIEFLSQDAVRIREGMDCGSSVFRKIQFLHGRL